MHVHADILDALPAEVQRRPYNPDPPEAALPIRQCGYHRNRMLYLQLIGFGLAQPEHTLFTSALISIGMAAGHCVGLKIFPDLLRASCLQH